MTCTNEDMANHFLNVSLQNKLSTSLKSYMKAYATTIPAHAPWLPEYFASFTSGRPWRPTATILSKDSYPARNMATSFTKNRNSSIRKVGNGHSRPFLLEQRPSKIPDSSRRLLHQVDRSQTISHHYSPTSSTIRLEGYHMPVWRPAYNHHRQWLIVYSQRTC